MAIFEKTIRNKNFDKLLRKLENEIPDSSWSADLEAGSDFKEGDARCSVRVFERYSMMGGNINQAQSRVENTKGKIKRVLALLKKMREDVDVQIADEKEKQEQLAVETEL